MKSELTGAPLPCCLKHVKCPLPEELSLFFDSLCNQCIVHP